MMATNRQEWIAWLRKRRLVNNHLLGFLQNSPKEIPIADVEFLFRDIPQVKMDTLACLTWCFSNIKLLLILTPSLHCINKDCFGFKKQKDTKESLKKLNQDQSLFLSHTWSLEVDSLQEPRLLLPYCSAMNGFHSQDPFWSKMGAKVPDIMTTFQTSGRRKRRKGKSPFF